jgi:hypothetical protein
MTNETEKVRDDAGLWAALACVALIGAALAFVGGAIFGLRVGFGIATGATLGLLNLYVIARIVRAFLGSSSHRAFWTIVTLLKFSGLFALVYFLLDSEAIGVLPLVAGYGALPLGIVVGQLMPAAPARLKG